MKSSILFINPKSINRDGLPIPPLGILSLAAFIRENGYSEIGVLDNAKKHLNVSEIEREILKYDVVGVTGTTPQYKNAAEIIKIAKKNGKLVVVGGVHATSVFEEVLEQTGADIVVIGEGEETLLEILNCLDSDSDFYNIDGIAFMCNGEVTKTLSRSFIKDLDSLPFPARDLVDMREYGNKELKRFDGKYTHMMSSRGCGMHCTFCVSPVMWKYGRFMTAERIFKEMMFIYDEYNIKNIHFQDDNFTSIRRRMLKLCNLIDNSGIDFKWSCQTRSTNVDEELLKKMKCSGCVQIEYGVESGDAQIIKNIKKKYTKKQVKRAFDITRKVGIFTYGFFIIGLPGETILTWLKTIFFAIRLRMSGCAWSVLIPFPGTEIYNKKLVTIIDDDYVNWLYKKPVIRVGIFGPMMLNIMRWIADRCTNGLFNTGTYKR